MCEHKPLAITFLCLGVLSAIIAGYFVALNLSYAPITREEAVPSEGIVEDVSNHIYIDVISLMLREVRFVQGRMKIIFDDGSKARISSEIVKGNASPHQSDYGVNDSLRYDDDSVSYNHLQAVLMKLDGEKVKVLINKKANTVMEITHGDDVIVDFDRSVDILEYYRLKHICYAVGAVVTALVFWISSFIVFKKY